MLKKVFAVTALGGLMAVVVAAGGFFALRLYSAPLEQRLLAQTRQLQGLARDLHDEVRAVNQADFSVLAALRRDDARIDRLLDRWREAYQGGWHPAMLVVPVGAIRDTLARWDTTHGQVTDLLARERVLKGIGGAITLLDKTAATLLDQAEQVVRELVRSGADSRDVYFASRQIVLIQRISQHLHTLLKPSAWRGDFTESSRYEALVRDSALFERTLEAMLKGDRRMGIAPGGDARVRQRLRDNGKMFASINRDIGRILSMVPVLQDIQHTVGALRVSSRDFAQRSGGLAQTLLTYRTRDDSLFAALFLAALAALIVLSAYGIYSQRRFRSRLAFSIAQNTRFKQALSDLQPVLEALADGRVAAGELDAGAGVEGVIAPFNRAMAQWRNTLIAIKGWTGKLAPLAQRVNGAADKLADGSARQIEGTAASSAGLNRAVSTVDRAATHVADMSRALESLKAGCAEARRRLQHTEEADRALVHRSQAQAQRIESLVGQLNALAQGVEELSVMVLHLLVRVQDAGQAGHEPVSYANRALQVAHQCTEAVEQLDEGLTQLGEENGGREADAAGPGPRASLNQDLEAHLGAMDTSSDRIAGLLQETAPLLAELTAALLSVSDDLDTIHEYTMQASNETADVSKAGKRIAELVEHIGRSIDKYNIMQ